MNANPKPTELVPELDQAKHFLTLLDEEAEAFTFQTFTDGKPKPNPDPLARQLIGTFAEHAETLSELNRQGAGIFVTINETDGNGRRKENIIRIRALWQEADRGDEPGLPVEPHIIVESSTGKHHRYVLVDDAPLDEFEPVQERLVRDYGSDPNAKDRSRVLRLPGFYHLKNPEEPHLVRVVHESGAQPIPWSEAVRHFPPVSDSTRRQTTEPPPEGTALHNAAEARSALAELDPDMGYMDWLRIGMALHSTGAGREAFELWDAWSATGALYRPKECAYRWKSFRRDRSAMVTVKTLFHMARKAGWKGRNYDQILADAEAMDQDTDLAQIEALIVEAAANLSPIKRDRVFAAIKNATGMRLGTIQEVAAAALKSDKDDQVLDHLGLAQSVIASVGAENLIGVQSHIWKYQKDRGVWRPLEPRAEKQMVQDHLSADHPKVTLTRHLVDSVTDVLRTEVYRPEHQWNVGPSDAVVVPNGELVLRDGRWVLEIPRREHFRTVLVPVAYDPSAEAPRFFEFLTEIFADDEDFLEKIVVLMEMIGYSLMSHARYEKFVILIGNGANGKSVLLAVVEALCGLDNVAAVQPSEFGNKFQRAHLNLKLVNLVTEIREGEQIDDGALKAIVSGEASTVEHKGRDPFVFRPVSTCWFGANHLPHTRDFSDATFRRAIVIPFNRKFTPGVDEDPTLKDKLLMELPGVLKFALDVYAHAVQRGQFTEPTSCTEAKQAWRLEADQARQFAEECCILGDGRETSYDVYQAYTRWAREVGIHLKLKHKTLTQRLERLGCGSAKSDNVRYITGLRFNDRGRHRATDFESEDIATGGDEEGP